MYLRNAVQRYEKYFNSAQNKVKKNFFLPFSLDNRKKIGKFALETY
jgi:hypothetical protein